MDEYRQTIAGRALADVLQELERSGSLDARNGDALFELFDAAVQEEILVAGSKRTRADASADASSSSSTAQPSLFTHDKLEVRARVESYNRFNEKWSITATLNDGDSDDARSALTLDKAALPLPPPHAARMLLKLHSPPPSLPAQRR